MNQARTNAAMEEVLEHAIRDGIPRVSSEESADARRLRGLYLMGASGTRFDKLVNHAEISSQSQSNHRFADSIAAPSRSQHPWYAGGAPAAASDRRFGETLFNLISLIVFDCLLACYNVTEMNLSFRRACRGFSSSIGHAQRA
jgi:hypothetical protein